MEPRRLKMIRARTTSNLSSISAIPSEHRTIARIIKKRRVPVSPFLPKCTLGAFVPCASVGDVGIGEEELVGSRWWESCLGYDDDEKKDHQPREKEKERSVSRRDWLELMPPVKSGSGVRVTLVERLGRARASRENWIMRRKCQ